MYVSIALFHTPHLLMLINIMDHKSSWEKVFCFVDIFFPNTKRHRSGEDTRTLLWTVFVHSISQILDQSQFKLRVQTCMFYRSQNVQHTGDAWSIHPHESHFTVYQQPTSTCFSPSQEKEVDIPILFDTWRIKTQWDLCDLIQVVQENIASIRDSNLLFSF